MASLPASLPASYLPPDLPADLPQLKNEKNRRNKEHIQRRKRRRCFLFFKTAYLLHQMLCSQDTQARGEPLVNNTVCLTAGLLKKITQNRKRFLSVTRFP